jgi:large subunit ribosomal protein L17
MRHAIAHRKLGRTPGHRKALLRNMMNSLVRSERIETTIAKAKEVRRLADRLITLGKKDSTHARRRAFSMLSNKENTEKIFATLATRFTGREGGYTRIVRTGYRAGDGSELEKKAKAKKGKKTKTAAAKVKEAAEKAVRGKTARTAKKETGEKTPAPRKKKAPTDGEKDKPSRKRKTRKETE